MIRKKRLSLVKILALTNISQKRLRQMDSKDCCNCGCISRKSDTKEMTLAELPVGTSATIVKVMPEMRGRKKFADVGLVAGTELQMEARAPLGGLLRVKVMETSMALHKDDAANIVIRQENKNEK